MKICPKCNGRLIGIDTLGFFAFDKKAIRYYFVGLFAFFIWFWSNLLYVLAPKEIVTFILVVYYIIGLLLLVKFYAYYASKVIYECRVCKNRFMANSTETFSYKEWSKAEYNKSLKKDAQ